MKPSSKALLGVAMLLSLALAAFLILHQNSPSDRDQILSQLEVARAAAQAHDANGILKIVSADYHDALLFDTNDRLALGLRQIVKGKNSGNVQVTLTPPDVKVEGETATSTSHLTVASPGGTSTFYDSDVTLHWKQEEGRRMLIFPAKVWRVTSADYNAGALGGE